MNSNILCVAHLFFACYHDQENRSEASENGAANLTAIARMLSASSTWSCFQAFPRCWRLLLNCSSGHSCRRGRPWGSKCRCQGSRRGTEWSSTSGCRDSTPRARCHSTCCQGNSRRWGVGSNNIGPRSSSLSRGALPFRLKSDKIVKNIQQVCPRLGLFQTAPPSRVGF